MRPREERDLHFPKAGVDLSRAFFLQSARPGPDGRKPLYTTPDAANVRAYDSLDRFRGGSRPGYSRWIDAALDAGWIVQHLDLVVAVGIDPPGGNVQLSQSGRVVTVVAVSQGDIFVANPGDTSWTAAINSTVGIPALNFTGVMQSAANNQKLYFADGTNWVYYDPSINTADDWTASSGTLPADADDNTPRLICTWRGRTVVSGIVGDAQNWFMSQLGDPRNWNYSPASPSAIDAVAGNNSSLGLIGDAVTALIPFNDDVLVFGGTNSIYRMLGDPMDGGVISKVSSAIGIAWGKAWCQGPDGTIYFMSNMGEIYAFQPNGQPVHISQGIKPLLNALDTGESVIRLEWNDRRKGIHVFVTGRDRLPNGNAPGGTHFFFEARQGAWWPDEFADDDHNPVCSCVLDGNTAADRCVLVGGWDGYVRFEDEDATTDDGVPIESRVTLGPILTAAGDEMTLWEAQPIMAEDSGDVDWGVQLGDTAEQALASEPLASVSGTWGAGRGLTEEINRSAHAIYMRLSSIVRWAMESVRLVFGPRGKIKRRGA